MPNRLADQLSPYLLQHADNPVDWYPWGPEALARARDEQKAIFLSIGYSACHWCHVMERESFEDQRIAGLMNEHFVCIKVDREERPDLDQIYMNAVVGLTGHGGWPMSVFLTPELKPFYGGTYWPPEPRMNMPGFDQVLEAVTTWWRDNRDQARLQAARLTEHLDRRAAPESSGEPAVAGLLDTALAQLREAFDPTHGGFGAAPKFPHPLDVQLLLRIFSRTGADDALQMARLTLDRMARGGIYDHLRGGFARYSVDARWLVPHFEKMLYDNALLAGAYLDGYLVTGRADFARVVQETLDYVLAEMTDPQGGFFSAQDADSEGVEGKYYVWTPAQVLDVLGPEAGERFCRVYDVTEHGNFEGSNVLNLPQPIEQCAEQLGCDVEALRTELAASRDALLDARRRRVPPRTDDKVLVGWNALMIESLARAAGVLDCPDYLAAATQAAEFIHQQMRRDDGRLLHCWRAGQARFDAYLDDYAALAGALVTLYQAGFEERWIDWAVELADTILARFADRAAGGFFFTADDHETLIVRNKDLIDNAVPSGGALAAATLVRLGKLCGRTDYLQAAADTLDAASAWMGQSPLATPMMLMALDMQLGPMPEIVVLGDPHQADTVAALADLRRRWIPNHVLACRPAAEVPDGSAELDPIFIGRHPLAEQPTVFLCERFACRQPVAGLAAAVALWQQLGARSS